MSYFITECLKVSPGHMIHHLVPEKVVEAIDLAASRSGLAETNQLTPMQPGTVDADPQPAAT